MAGIFGGGNPYPPIPDPAPAGGYGPAYGAYGQDYGGYGGGDYGPDYGGGSDPAPPPIPGPAPVGGYGAAYGAYGDPTQRGFLERATDWLGSEKGQRAMQQLGGFSAGMLQGSAPSLTPRNFSTGLGMGMEGFQKAGSQYYQDALHRAQAAKSEADVANLALSSKMLQEEYLRANGLPPGGGIPGVGGGAWPAQAPAGAGGGGGPSGPFAQYAPLIQKYESSGRPYVGTGGTDLTNAPLSETGFPQWAGVPVGKTRSTAAGLYQITQTTWDPIARQLGIKDFSPESQHRVAEELFRQRGLDPWLPYNKNLAAAIGRGEAPNPFAVARAAPAGGGGVPIPPPIRPPSPADAGTAVAAPTALQQRFPALAGRGLLPPAAPAPAATAPPPVAAAPAAPAPAATSGTSRPPAAAAAPAAGGAAPKPAEFTAVGDSLAGHLIRKAKTGGKEYVFDRKDDSTAVAGYDPSQVLDLINSAPQGSIEGKNVILSSGASNDPQQLDRIPEQIKALRERNVAGITLIGVGTAKKLAGVNDRLAQIAADNGVAFAGPLAKVAGDGIHSRDPKAVLQQAAAAPQPSGEQQYPRPGDPGGGGGDTGDGTAPAGPMSLPVRPAGPRPSPQMSMPGDLAYGETPVPAPAAVGASPPPPAPGATMAPAPPPGPPAPVATLPAPPIPGAPAGPVQAGGATLPAPPRPLPVPNLGQVQPGMPAYDVAAAARAQRLSIALGLGGRAVPGYLTAQANLPIEAQKQIWELQKQQYGAQLDAGRDQWKAMSDLQKEQYATSLGISKAQVESELRKREEDYKAGRMIDPATGRVVERPGFNEAEAAKAAAIKAAESNAALPAKMQEIFGERWADLQKDWDTPKKVDYNDADGTPRTTYLTPRQVAAGQVPGAPVPGAAVPTPPPATGAPPGPGAAAPAPAATVPQGYRSGTSEADKARIELDKSTALEVAKTATTGRQLMPVLDEIIRIANATPQGWRGPIGARLASVISGFGIPVSEQLSNAEVMRSLAQQLIPTVRQPGAQSNKEMEVYQLAVPGLSQSAVGRLQIASINKAMITRAEEIAALYHDNIGAKDLSKKLAELDAKPLFTDQQRAVMQAAAGRRVTDDATFDLLPIGMEFTDAKGNRTTKKANRTPPAQ